MCFFCSCGCVHVFMRNVALCGSEHVCGQTLRQFTGEESRSHMTYNATSRVRAPAENPRPPLPALSPVCLQGQQNELDRWDSQTTLFRKQMQLNETPLLCSLLDVCQWSKYVTLPMSKPCLLWNTGLHQHSTSCPCYDAILPCLPHGVLD